MLEIDAIKNIPSLLEKISDDLNSFHDRKHKEFTELLTIITFSFSVFTAISFLFLNVIDATEYFADFLLFWFIVLLLLYSIFWFLSEILPEHSMKYQFIQDFVAYIAKSRFGDLFKKYKKDLKKISSFIIALFFTYKLIPSIQNFLFLSPGMPSYHDNFDEYMGELGAFVTFGLAFLFLIIVSPLVFIFVIMKAKQSFNRFLKYSSIYGHLTTLKESIIRDALRSQEIDLEKQKEQYYTFLIGKIPENEKDSEQAN